MAQTGIFRKKAFSQLPNPIYLRMAGYAVTLAVHCTTIVQMTHRYKGEVQKDPDVAAFQQYQLRLLTVWNLLTQVFYAALGLSCDVLTLTREGKDSALLKLLKSARDILFSSVVFPITMTVFTVFWTFFSYEPTLILPAGVVKAILPIENFLIHTFVVPVALWEVACRPRKVPTSHLLNFAIELVYAAVFIAVLFFTYYEANHFMYPILTRTYGTPYFFAFLGTCFIVILTFYRIQWYLTEFLWGAKQETKKIK